MSVEEVVDWRAHGRGHDDNSMGWSKKEIRGSIIIISRWKQARLVQIIASRYKMQIQIG